ncbi:hypothetical protein BDP27DRAFT_1369447 [Rhodocollybia butyracea]|uniref:Uncharacterized protein n=1 Tax=Rhodocollybia butyracea TaxID=206335 RepID=A0A9P5PB32_9AGAR|nr:hypothetical protein BDP27DRAFT_1369447 [Rhodocollybia butyracea]
MHEHTPLSVPYQRHLLLKESPCPNKPPEVKPLELSVNKGQTRNLGGTNMKNAIPPETVVLFAGRKVTFGAWLRGCPGNYDNVELIGVGVDDVVRWQVKMSSRQANPDQTNLVLEAYTRTARGKFNSSILATCIQQLSKTAMKIAQIGKKPKILSSLEVKARSFFSQGSETLRIAEDSIGHTMACGLVLEILAIDYQQWLVSVLPLIGAIVGGVFGGFRSSFFYLKDSRTQN